MEVKIRLEDQYKINDCHVHVGRMSGINQSLNTEDIIDFKKQNNIDKVLLLASDSDPEKSNNMVEFLVDNIPDTYGLHWWINGVNNIKLTNKIIGVKYHGTYAKKPITSLNPRIFEALDKHKAILMVHCGRYLEGDIKSNTSYLHALQVARKYPNIKVILSHMGGTDTTVCKKAIMHGTMIHNVYFDTSGITTPFIIEHACDRLPTTRILFGSDSPWCSFKAMYNTVMDAIVNKLEKKDILHDSFELLLK